MKMEGGRPASVGPPSSALSRGAAVGALRPRVSAAPNANETIAIETPIARPFFVGRSVSNDPILAFF